MLSVENLSVSVDGKQLLNDVNLTVSNGEVHALMGENGSGKSTLSLAIAGHPRYLVTEGKIIFNGEDITGMPVNERSCKGIFLSLQNPPEIEGVRLSRFLTEAKKSHVGKDNFHVLNFQKQMQENLKKFGFDSSLLRRSIHLGFSGGEKKKVELFQMSLLMPKLAILDEFDSGLDIDSLRLTASFLQILRESNPEMSFLVITHYSRVFEYLQPDKVHVMMQGKIVKSGGAELVENIEQAGYAVVK